MKTTFTKASLRYAEMKRDGFVLAWQRAEEKFDIHAMQVACARGAYWETEIIKRGGKLSRPQRDRNDFTALA